MRARGAFALAVAVLAVAVAGSTAATAAAPVKPKNGVYQGATRQYLPLGFKVVGRDAIAGLYFGSDFGDCEGFVWLSNKEKPISNSGRFKIVVDSDPGVYTVRGRFISKTRARGRVVYAAPDKTECGITDATTRFRVVRTPRL